MTKLNKTVIVRLTEEDYDKFLSNVMLSGYTRSEFLRNAILGNKTKIVAKNDATNLLYHLNKIGNNINQLAYRANLDNLENKISEETYRSILKSLSIIQNKLNSLLSITINSSKNIIGKDDLWLLELRMERRGLKNI